MPTTIYYFSATGNSLHVAKTLAKQLGESKVINMAEPVLDRAIEDTSDTIGIVFPAYYETMPLLVQDFVKKLKLDPKAYIFGVATSSGLPGNSLPTLDAIIREKGGYLSAGFAIQMPGTLVYIFNRSVPSERQDKLLKASEGEIAKIVGILEKREKPGIKRVPAPFNRIQRGLWKAYGGLWKTHLSRKLPGQFYATDRCSGCGTCERVCPVGNIKRNDKPTWDDHCTHCLACFHWCPRQAIQVGKKSASDARYHHPDIDVKEIMLR